MSMWKLSEFERCLSIRENLLIVDSVCDEINSAYAQQAMKLLEIAFLIANKDSAPKGRVY